jgi:hypothetical protein
LSLLDEVQPASMRWLPGTTMLRKHKRRHGAGVRELRRMNQAAASNPEVSKALLITGMCGAKVGAVFLAVFTGVAGWAASARSHCPLSWERATEKNRST